MSIDKNPPHGHDFVGADGHRLEDVGHVEDWDGMALDLLEGTLPSHVAAALETHLATCPDCRRALAEQQSVASMLRAVPEVAVPGDVEHVILAGLAGLSEHGTARAADPTSVRDRGNGEVRSGGEALRSLRRLLNVRVWLPAAAVVLIAGIALSSYSLIYSGTDGDGSRTATESALKDTVGAPTNGGAEDSSTFQAVPEGMDSQTTVAGAATTTTAASTEMTDAVASFVVLTVGIPGDDPDILALRVEDLTGLEPLPRDSWVGERTTYAAQIATDEVALLATGLDAVTTETLPFGRQALRVPPSLAEALGQGEAGNTLPVLTMRSSGDAPTGPSWTPDREAGSRSDIASGLTVVVITVGTGALR